MGTIYCHQHDEAEVYGSEPVPCPFCGLGANTDPVAEQAPSGPVTEDSNEALRHALFDTEPSESRVHW